MTSFAPASQVPVPFPLPPSAGFVVPVVRSVLAFALVYLPGRLFVVPAVDRVVRARNRNNPTLRQAVTRYVEALVVLVAAAAALTAGGTDTS
ncbi:hypothetical protein [Halegenticoccus soli]|uniref:hypothetical protein n=1 Tax=Halegenticoccus soli TaxID=1985678 RepID=UPI000C6DE2BB|nr:hypothetical protein [Halegenticoccus soli]